MKKFFTILWVLFFSIGANLNAQTNTRSVKAEPVAQLSDEVNESSGLIYFNGSFWTMNDSGNSNTIYRMHNKTGKVKQRVKISNAENVDWEELADDGTYIYVCDIGDNKNRRDEKQVYRIKKKELYNNEKNFKAKADIIQFKYPRVNGQDPMYNAEALFCYNGTLHLFTKELTTSRHFTIPATPGNYTAAFVEEFNSKALITGAARDKKTGTILLVGYYKDKEPVLWKLSNYSKGKFFNGVNTFYDLDMGTKACQTEGICLAPDGNIYISNENHGKMPQYLWRITWKQLL